LLDIIRQVGKLDRVVCDF